MSKYSLCATTDFYQLPKTDSVGRYQEIRRLLDNLNQLRLDEVLETLKKFDKKNLDANSNFSPTSLLVNDYEKDERLESLLFQCVTAIPTGTTADWKDFDQKQSGIFDLLAPMFTNTTMCKALLLSATQNTNMVKHIVTKYKNISLTFTSDQSESVLHLCCISGTERPFKAVLSALMGATLSKPELVDLLLQKDVRGRTALQYACAHGNLDMVNSVHDLCGKAELPFSKLLREKDSEGHTCLTLAIMSPSLKLTKFLLKNGADVGLGGIFALSSPLHIACWFANRIEQLERREIVKELLKRGAQINPSDSSGSAVHIASYGHGGQTDGEVIKWLIESNGGKEALNNRK